MRWSCPHCGTNLAVTDDKLGSGWSFSRCYKCGGFALVRRSEVNLIKVDKAPVGENVLLPEATETPVLSQQATQKLEQILSEKNSAAKPANNPTNNLTTRPSVIPTKRRTPAPESHTAADSGIPAAATLPPPLPEALHPVHASRSRLLPVAISATGVIAAASGVYLYLQGQILWEKARLNARNNTRTVAAVANNEAPPAPPRPVADIRPAAAEQLITDQLHQRAMAPTREPGPAAAPATLAAAAQSPSFTVKTRQPNVKLRSGPGMAYPVVGIADPDTQYTVVEWNERWFKITPQHSDDSRTASTSAEDLSDVPTWIRNDLVQPVPSGQP